MRSVVQLERDYLLTVRNKLEENLQGACDYVMPPRQREKPFATSTASMAMRVAMPGTRNEPFLLQSAAQQPSTACLEDIHAFRAKIHEILHEDNPAAESQKLLTAKDSDFNLNQEHEQLVIATQEHCPSNTQQEEEQQQDQDWEACLQDMQTQGDGTTFADYLCCVLKNKELCKELGLPFQSEEQSRSSLQRPILACEGLAINFLYTLGVSMDTVRF